MKELYKKLKTVLNRQIVRFMIVGALNTLASYIAYLIVIFISDENYILANIAGFIAGTINAYLGNSKYVFRQREKKADIKHVMKTFLSYGSTCMINTSLLYVLINYLNISVLIAPVINSGIIFILNFILNKFWVYRSKER